MTPIGEFSHKVAVDPWPEDGMLVELTATAAEREALRARFDLLDLTSLHASVGIEKNVMELRLVGTIEATVSQACVVTLEPVSSSLHVPFERRCRRREAHERIMAADDALSLDEEAAEIDLLEGDEIDVGEVIAEELYLALAPYPRASDADRALEELRTKIGTDSSDQAASPFAGLRRH